MLVYAKQQSADLTYYLFEGSVPRNSVRVLAERTLDLPDGTIRLAIIGSSHFLEIETRDVTVCEMLACPRPGLETITGYVETMRTGKGSHRVRLGNLGYQFNLSSSRRSSDRFLADTTELGLPKPNRLRFSFPAGDEAGSGLTCLEWQTDGNRATVATYHTFPSELAIVRTRSVIDFAEEGA